MLAIDGTRLYFEAWAGERPLDDPLISPIHGDLSNIAPLTIFSGTDEILLPDIKLFAEKARSAGTSADVHIYPHMKHCFVLFPIKEAKDAINKTVDAIKKHEPVKIRK